MAIFENWNESTTSIRFGFLQEWSQLPTSISDTPVPVFHTNVMVDDARVDPGAGLVICALTPEVAV